MNQRCRTCNLIKPMTEYFWRNKSKKRRRTQCKKCYSINRKKTQKQHYQKYKKEYLHRAKLNKRKRKAELLEFVNGYKTKPCTDCGKTFHPIAMDFDHVDDNKIASISFMVNQLYKQEKILTEINKCELVCACCHRLRTFYRETNE